MSRFYFHIFLEVRIKETNKFQVENRRLLLYFMQQIRLCYKIKTDSKVGNTTKRGETISSRGR